MSSVRSVFAQNLRALCKAKGLSVNAACKGLGIPRSQMDRYLNGDNLPNNRNLARISAFFGVKEPALFAEGGPAKEPSASAAPRTQCDEVIDLLLEAGPSSIVPGTYQVLYASLLDPSKAMASLLFIGRKGDTTGFRRLTRFPGRNQVSTAVQQYRGDHRGIVVDRFGAHYFVGMNRVSTKEPSITVMKPTPLGGPVLSGQAIVMAEEGPLAVPVVMQPLPKDLKLREAIQGLGLFDLSSPVVGALAARLLRRATP